MIKIGRQHGSYFYTLLGGEPMLYDDIWAIIEQHRDCYFQIISNGLFFDDEAADRIRRLGNVTPLVSIDGPEEINDRRRGEGVFRDAMAGLERLQKRKILYGIATTLTAANMEASLTDEYVEQFIERGAMYLWYYGFRPVGADPSPELCMTPQHMLQFRRRILELRRKHPIILIDTYWDAQGHAVCPAARGLGFHIGPAGDINPCPPLSFACETIDDHDGDLFRTINESEFLRGFQDFVDERTKGCVILEQPDELADFLRQSGVQDYSGRDALAEIAASQRRTSHHLPGEELPEDFWFYRFLKRTLFFGMGGYG
jgi:MoaA/NifB/PqqE/SkfB family radical SAM enzyme